MDSFLRWMLSSIIVLAACSRDKEIDKIPVSNGNEGPFLEVHMGFTVGHSWVTDQDQRFYIDGGRPCIVRFPQMYLSDLRLVLADDDTISLSEIVLLNVHQPIQKLALWDERMMQATTLLFCFGVPPDVNSGVMPVDFSLDHPLGPRMPSMWWTWDDGYIMARLEGRVNSSHPPQDSLNHGYSWHIGFDENFKPDLAYDISGMDVQNLAIVLNVEELMSRIDIPLQLYSMSTRGAALDAIIAHEMVQSIHVMEKL